MTFLRKIPIKITDSNIRKHIISFIDKILIPDISDNIYLCLERQIDELVFKLYDLTYEEVLVVCPDFWLSEEEYAMIEID